MRTKKTLLPVLQSAKISLLNEINKDLKRGLSTRDSILKLVPLLSSLLQIEYTIKENTTLNQYGMKVQFISDGHSLTLKF